jgi:hypothetical protein
VASTLRFFAATSDQRALLDFIFCETDAIVTPLSSTPGEDLPIFRGTSEVESRIELGLDQHGGGAAITLIIASASVQLFAIRRVDFDPKKVRSGPLFRFEPAGSGLIQLYLGGVHGHVLTKSYIGHNTLERAKAWHQHEGVNWQALLKLGNQIRYHISRRLAVAKAGPMPVLHEAYKLKQAGYSLKENARAAWEYQIDPTSAPS